MSFDGKVCVVTGGSAGIGEAIVRAFAAEGGRAVILDVDRARGLQIREEVPGSTFVECNVADAAAVERAFASVVSNCGQVDVLVNNAGIVGKEEYQRAQAIREQQFSEISTNGRIKRRSARQSISRTSSGKECRRFT